MSNPPLAAAALTSSALPIRMGVRNPPAFSLAALSSMRASVPSG